MTAIQNKMDMTEESGPQKMEDFTSFFENLYYV